MVSTAYAMAPNIVVIAVQNHCAIPVAAGISTYRPLVLCSAIRPSGPNRPAMRTPGRATSSSSSLIRAFLSCLACDIWTGRRLAHGCPPQGVLWLPLLPPLRHYDDGHKDPQYRPPGLAE